MDAAAIVPEHRPGSPRIHTGHGAFSEPSTGLRIVVDEYRVKSFAINPDFYR